MSFFEETFSRIQTATHTRTQSELAALLDIKQSSISGAKKRQTIPAEWYMRLFEKLGISPDWLQQGLGPMHLRTTGPCAECAGAGEPHAGSPQTIPLPVYAMHGSFGQSVPRRDALQELCTIALPCAYAREHIMVLAVDSDALAPAVRKGARAGIDTSSTHPVSGDIYAVFMPHEGIVLRRLFWEQRSVSFILRAMHAAYPELRLSALDCAGRILGRLAWVLQEL